MPFGLCLLSLFSIMVEWFLEIFMDDFSIYGDSFNQYLYHLELVLQRCTKKNLTLNWEKYHFMVRQGIVLGHEISRRGIEVDKAKIEVIAKLPTSKCIQDIWYFLGVGFYWRFIKHFSKIARPLTNCSRRTRPLILTMDVLDHEKSLSKNLSLRLSFLLQTGPNHFRSVWCPRPCHRRCPRKAPIIGSMWSTIRVGL